jgi:hypothetical protein
MFLQRVTNYLLRHRIFALTLTFFITFVPVIRVVGVLIAAFMTLIKGAWAGLIFTLAVLVATGVGLYFVANHDPAIPTAFLWVISVSALLANGLTWVFAVMLRRQTSWSTITQVAALGTALVISLIHILYPAVADWWAIWAVKLQTQAKLNLNPNEFMEMINLNKPYATGIALAAILITAFSQVIVARWWLAVLYSPGSLRRGLQSIRLSRLAGILFVASLVLAYLGNAVILDIMPVLYLLFFGAGLSFVHYFFNTMPPSKRWIWLSIFYVALLLLLPFSAMLVVGLALADGMLDLRKRLSKA